MVKSKSTVQIEKLDYYLVFFLKDIQQVFPTSENNSSSNYTSTSATTNDLVLSILTFSAIVLSLLGLLITMLTFICFK